MTTIECQLIIPNIKLDSVSLGILTLGGGIVDYEILKFCIFDTKTLLNIIIID